MKNLKKFNFVFLLFLTFFLPVVSFGAGSSVDAVCSSTTNNIGDLLCRVGVFLNQIIPVLLSLGIVYFVWGVVTYVIGDDEEAKKKGKDRVIYGIIGLVVIVGMWGLVSMVISSLGISATNSAITNSASFVPLPADSGFCRAGGLPPDPKLGDLINYVTCTIAKSVVPLIFTLAIVFFIWGVVQYVINDEEEAKKEKGRQFMIWGIIALTVMVSMWGLVSVVGGSFGIMGGIPQVRTR